MSVEAGKRSQIFILVKKAVQQINQANLKKAYKSRRFMRWFKRGVIFVIALHLIGIVFNFLSFQTEFWDGDTNRGSTATTEALFDENHNTPTYLKQGWSKNESLWFYRTTQGSNLLPYDFYMSLEQAGNQKLFSSVENISKYQFLIQKSSFSNPDALPVGFAKDTFIGKEYIGFTCAACHSSQVNYKNEDTGETHAIRIDGGPAQSDVEQFMGDLSAALEETLCLVDEEDCNKEKFDRFVTKILERNGLKKALLEDRNYTSKEEIRRDLEALSQSIKFYNQVNNPPTPYGFARLDAFGRIYNRVAQHVIDSKTLENIFNEFLEEDQTQEILDKIDSNTNEEIHLVDIALNYLSDDQKKTFISTAFTEANAPVSYPYLWDIPYHNYLQWNGMVNNASAGALGRNVGQVIGVFGTLNWKASKGFSPSDLLIKNKSVLEKINFHSSINVRNLIRIEDQLKKLRSPEWPVEILGELNVDKSKEGKRIFNEYCLACHHNIDRKDSQRRITSHLSGIQHVGTDPKMAENSAKKIGYTGILQGSYVNVPVGRIMLQEKAPVALMVTATTENSLKTPDFDTSILARWSDWMYDMFFAIFENPIEETIKKGNYDVDTTVNPLASYLSYKARPLNGIWATAPYLHNGSVPTLYDLLLPVEERPKVFMVGSREFEKDKVGFKYKDYEGFLFDTSKEGNHNTGHEYAAGRTALPNGKRLKALDEAERLALLEYLKSL